MNKTSDMTLRVDRALNIFERRGGAGEFTKPFQDFANDIQSELSNAAGIQEDEVPVIASYRAPDSWVLLTSRRLVWQEGGDCESLPWERIRDATIPMSAMAALRSSVKLENARLEVVTDTGKVEVLVEPGKPLSGFWNVLKTVPSLT